MVFKEKRDRILYTEDDVEMGKILFDTRDDIIIINHTLVPKENSGKGIASALVKEVVEKAKKEDKKILPLCPYAKKFLESDEKYKDILSK